jgi:hypothetical protein
MRIVRDENIPHPLKDLFAEPGENSVQEMDLGGLLNGDLSTKTDGRFDVFITPTRISDISKICSLDKSRLSNCRQIVCQP